MGMEAKCIMDYVVSGELNEDADKGNVFKMFPYEWERGITW